MHFNKQQLKVTKVKKNKLFFPQKLDFRVAVANILIATQK